MPVHNSGNMSLQPVIVSPSASTITIAETVTASATDVESTVMVSEIQTVPRPQTGPTCSYPNPQLLTQCGSQFNGAWGIEWPPATAPDMLGLKVADEANCYLEFVNGQPIIGSLQQVLNNYFANEVTAAQCVNRTLCAQAAYTALNGQVPSGVTAWTPQGGAPPVGKQYNPNLSYQYYAFGFAYPGAASTHGSCEMVFEWIDNCNVRWFALAFWQNSSGSKSTGSACAPLLRLLCCGAAGEEDEANDGTGRPPSTTVTTTHDVSAGISPAVNASGAPAGVQMSRHLS